MVKHTLLITFLNLLFMALLGGRGAQAQSGWPPFIIEMEPTYGDGRITYDLFFVSLLDPGDMTDLTIIVPLPEGTRYVSGGAQPSTEVTFDGREVKFFTPALDGNAIPVASFTVEAIDPSQTVFVAQPWLSWKGDPAGDYLAREVEIDITKPELTWSKPLQDRLLLEADAAVVDGITTFDIYATNLGGRTFDVVVNLPLPAGATLVSTEAPPLFTSSFDGREVSFKALELPEKIRTTLRVKVASEETGPPLLVTHAWASWRNQGDNVGTRIAAKGDVRTGDIVVDPHVDGWVTADAFGDVPFGNYDVTTLAVERVGPGALDVIFYTRDEIGPAGQPLFFVAYLSTDCANGKQYRIVYSHMNGRAVLQQWDGAGGAWEAGIPVDGALAGPRMVVVHAPVLPALAQGADYCAVGRVVNAAHNFSEPLEIEAVPNRSDPQLLMMLRVMDELEESKVGPYEVFGLLWQDLPDFSATAQPPGSNSQLFTGVGPSDLDPNAKYRYLDWMSIDALGAPVTPSSLNLEVPGAAEPVKGSGQASATAVTVGPPAVQPVAPADLRGKLAIPIDDGTGIYDLRIFAVPTGQELARIHDAHQPDFRYDGERVLFDREADGADFIYEADLSGGGETRISDAHNSEYPVYDKPGGRVAYGNTGLTLGMPEWARDANFNLEFKNEGFTAVIELPILDPPIVHLPELPDLPIDDLPDLPVPPPIIGRPGQPIPDPPIVGPPDLPIPDPPIADLPDLPGSREITLTLEVPLPVRAYPRRPFFYVQCSLLQPHKEAEERCRDLEGQGKLIPDAIGEIQGRFPVWTASDHIVYNGCNTWAGSKVCGVITVPSASTRAFSEGFTPARLTENANDLPSDSEGNWIAFSSLRDGDWEAYVMDLNGGQLRNLSQSPASNDGIPTLSPDGQWVAFVSDRSGSWAVWVVPTAGGEASLLFDLPSETPWGIGQRSWINERISWGGVEGDHPLPWNPPAVPDYGERYR